MFWNKRVMYYVYYMSGTWRIPGKCIIEDVTQLPWHYWGNISAFQNQRKNPKIYALKMTRFNESLPS